MDDLISSSERVPGGDGVARINVGGIRFLRLAPLEALRSAVREYGETHAAPACETLDHLAAHPTVVLCRDDYERLLWASGRARSDYRLSPEARRTFARIHDVLHEAIPPRRSTTALLGRDALCPLGAIRTEAPESAAV